MAPYVPELIDASASDAVRPNSSKTLHQRRISMLLPNPRTVGKPLGWVDPQGIRWVEVGPVPQERRVAKKFFGKRRVVVEKRW